MQGNTNDFPLPPFVRQFGSRHFMVSSRNKAYLFTERGWLLLKALQNVKVLDIVGFKTHFFAITLKSIWAWGSSQYGVLGNGKTIDHLPFFSKVRGFSNGDMIKQVITGERMAAILTKKGLLYTCGMESHGACKTSNKFKIAPLAWNMPVIKEIATITDPPPNFSPLVILTKNDGVMYYSFHASRWVYNPAASWTPHKKPQVFEVDAKLTLDHPDLHRSLALIYNEFCDGTGYTVV